MNAKEKHIDMPFSCINHIGIIKSSLILPKLFKLSFNNSRNDNLFLVYAQKNDRNHEKL